MKKLLFAILLSLPIMAVAGGDNAKYLAGAVPQKDGIVVFEKSFSVPGKTKAQMHDMLKTYLTQLVTQSIPGPTAYARMNMDTPDTIAARCCEWLVFKKKPLYLDRARMRYQINAFVSPGKARLQVTQISYYYEEDNEGMGGKVIRAEEWITDSEALNKTQTKLYPRSGKFRRKTIDRVKEIFEGAMDCAEEQAEKQVEQPVQKKRNHVVED